MKVFQGQSDVLLGYIRDGKALTGREKLNLIIQLSIPSILAQITSVVMFFIDQAMVGHLGAKASAACGLVETSTWLLGSLTGAASMGFSVQVAHFIGANDFVKARQVFRHALVVTFLLSLVTMVVAALIAKPLPYWLGGGADIARDASLYFFIFALAGPFFQLYSLSSAMLKCSGDMRMPSLLSIIMCVLDVGFNYILIYQAHLGGHRYGSLHRHLWVGAGIYRRLPQQDAVAEESGGAILLGGGLSEERFENRTAHGGTVGSHEWGADSGYHDCGTFGKHRHCCQHAGHHCGEPVLYAGLWYR